ncbi:MAG: NUDIX hydrolase [Bdellovibrionales bacterium]
MSNHTQSTIGAGAMIFQNEKVLLVQLNYGRARGAWILPGGMVEKGEHPEQTAIREVYEETGLSVRITGLIGIRHRIEKDHSANIYYIYKAEVADELAATLTWPEGEILEARFWEIDHALNDQSVRPLTREYIRHFLSNPNRLLTKKSIPKEHNLNDELFFS